MAPVAAEIWYRLARLPKDSRRQHLLTTEFQRWKKVLRWQSWGKSAAETFGHQKAAPEARGLLIDDWDIAIGAAALVYGAGLATCNPRHFSRLTGLHVLDWSRMPRPGKRPSDQQPSPKTHLHALSPAQFCLRASSVTPGVPDPSGYNEGRSSPCRLACPPHESVRAMSASASLPRIGRQHIHAVGKGDIAKNSKLGFAPPCYPSHRLYRPGRGRREDPHPPRALACLSP